MAGLLYRKILITLFALVLICQSGYCYESSFPFPFEFGHSSDIYLNVKKPDAKQINDTQKANEILTQRGISKNPKEIIKYIKYDEVNKIKLLINAGFQVNMMLDTNPPVYYAAKYNSFEVMKLLFESGADPNNGMNSSLRTAIVNGSKECAVLLVEKGADVNYHDHFSNEMVLYTALKKKYYELAKLMIEKGAKIDRKSYLVITKKHLDATYGINVN